MAGITAIFSAALDVNGYSVLSLFGKDQIPDYMSADYRECHFAFHRCVL